MKRAVTRKLAGIGTSENHTFHINAQAMLIQLIDVHHFQSTSFIATNASCLCIKSLEELNYFFKTHLYQSVENCILKILYSSREG